MLRQATARCRQAGRKLPWRRSAEAKSALPQGSARLARRRLVTGPELERIEKLASEVNEILSKEQFQERGLGSMAQHGAARALVSNLSKSSHEKLVVECISKELKDNELDRLMQRLPSDDVRAMGIAALSKSFDQDFRKVFDELDTNEDGKIDQPEFKRYLINLTSGGGMGQADAPTNRQLLLFGLNSAIPFVVFGALDNSIMILGGDVIEDLVSGTIKLSTLACAALANTFADVFGISIGNQVESVTKRLGLPGAGLTPPQKELPLVRRVGLFSSSFGIFVGCIIGMAPLLFVKADPKADPKEE